MSFRDETSPGDIELRDRALAKLTGHSGASDEPVQDIDARRLAILGKKQRLQRRFGRISLVAFSTTLLASWESIACLLQDGLINGGPASLVYGLLFAFAGSLATCASLAEMTSMLPTSAGQYHWVAELAPIRYAKSLSYAAGMITGFARLSIAASASYVAATEIQGLLVFNIESYEPHDWHGTFIYWGILMVAALVNILGIKFFPHIETLAFIHHVSFFFVFLVPLVYLSPRSTTSFVFANFENAGGWTSNGVSWGIGILASAWAFVGIDGTSHMSEEVKNSENVVPQSMMIAFFISGAMAFGASIAILFSVGDLNMILRTSTNYPIIEIFYTATQSKAATTAIISGLMLTSVFSTFGLLASASRLTWALARDNTFPFSNYFKHVDQGYLIPVRSILLITIVAGLLGFINIWSTTAFHAMTSLSLIGQYTSYLLPIMFMAVRRMGRKHVPYGPFKLGRYGFFINVVSIVYTLILVIFMVLPPYQPVTAKNMNYAGVVYGTVLLCIFAMWITHGRRVYEGPVKEVMDRMHVS